MVLMPVGPYVFYMKKNKRKSGILSMVQDVIQTHQTNKTERVKARSQSRTDKTRAKSEADIVAYQNGVEPRKRGGQMVLDSAVQVEKYAMGAVKDLGSNIMPALVPGMPSMNSVGGILDGILGDSGNFDTPQPRQNNIWMWLGFGLLLLFGLSKME